MVMKKVLVTGGTGLVGKALETVIKKKGPSEDEWYFVGSKEADLRDLVATQKLFEKYQPTHVIHLAAMVGGLFHNMNNNLEFLRCNLQINDNVLFASNQYNVNKVVSCLSTCIFPDNTTYPIDETMIHNGPPHTSNYGYSYAKRMIDITNRAYSDKYRRMYTSIIPCNIFGPHDNFKQGVSHVIPGMINRLYKTIDSNWIRFGDELIDGPKIDEQNKIFTVYGTGKPLRQFIYSMDLAQLIIWVLEKYDSVEPIILSVDESEEVSIANVAQSISNAFKFKGTIEYNTKLADGQYKKTASNKKLRSLLPDFKFTNFDEAIQETVNWFIKEQHTARV